jgi:hypothetical protein
VLGATAGAMAAPSGADAYRALGVKPQQVLTGTVVQARVVPGSGKQTVCLASFFTGKDEEAKAVNMKLGVFEVRGEQLVPVYVRDIGAENGVPVANGDLQVLDIDLDEVSEIVVTYDRFEDPLVEQRVAEVIVHGRDGLGPAWSGIVGYDATRAARTVPAERRDRWEREFDWAKTMRSRGVTLFVRKKVLAVAGQRLDAPQIVQETFELRGDAEHW